MASSYGTTGYMGIPLVIIAFGTNAALPAALATILHNIPVILAVIISFGIGKTNVEKSKLLIINDAFITVIKNPLTLSVLIGVLFSFFQIPIPEFIMNFANFLGVAAGPTALFALGLGIAKLEGKNNIRANVLLKIIPIVLIKIILQPLITFSIGFYLFELSLDDIYFKVAIIMSALPIGAGVYVFANKYDYYKNESAIAILISLIITIFTLSALLEIV